MGTCSSKSVVNQGNLLQLCNSLPLAARLFFYISALAMVVVVFFMVMRCYEKLEVCRRRRQARESESESERDPFLRARSGITCSNYGTRGGEDLERGDCSRSSCSSEELYDGKLCVICFDEERNCFFVPCGHCATCYDCAQRIYHGDNITCPVCRRMIRKVRKLFAP